MEREETERREIERRERQRKNIEKGRGRLGQRQRGGD